MKKTFTNGENMEKTKITNLEELINELDNDKLVMYLGNGVNLSDNAEKRIILFTHESKRAGAPCVLLDMAKVFVELGYCTFIVSHEETDFSAEYVTAGVNYICYDNYSEDLLWLKKVAEVFSTIIVNTLLLIPLVKKLMPIANEILWWMHEAEWVIKEWAEPIKEISGTSNLRILSASPLIQRNLLDYAGAESELLNFYVEDVPCKAYQKRDIVNIINVGNINGNKGQDILAKAYDMLDEATRAKSQLFFCVCNDQVEKELALWVLDFVDRHENVYIMEGMPKEELYELYEQMDIIVVASHYESTSAVAVEGLMKERLCICTENCGVCDYLKDGEDVFMFQRGNVVGLRDALNKAINHYDDYENIRKKGRAVYEQVYTKDVFTKRIKVIMNITE